MVKGERMGVVTPQALLRLKQGQHYSLPSPPLPSPHTLLSSHPLSPPSPSLPSSLSLPLDTHTHTHTHTHTPPPPPHLPDSCKLVPVEVSSETLLPSSRTGGKPRLLQPNHKTPQTLSPDESYSEEKRRVAEEAKGLNMYAAPC